MTGTHACLSPAFGGTCENSYGSFQCSCQAGYTGNGVDTTGLPDFIDSETEGGLAPGCNGKLLPNFCT